MHYDGLAGDIGILLSADLRVAEFGLSIDPRRQGRGLGTEAVQALVSLLLRHTPVATIVAAADARNLPCLRMLDKAGLRMTGERMAMFKGAPCTERVFAIERDGRRCLDKDGSCRSGHGRPYLPQPPRRAEEPRGGTEGVRRSIARW